jgi:hypothetical protein
MASAPTYEQIAYTSLGTAATSFTFSSIAASWTDLRLVIGNIVTANTAQPAIRFNGDSGLNYDWKNLSVTSGTTVTTNVGNSYGSIAVWVSGNTSTTIPSMSTLDIFQYANTGVYKGTLSITAGDRAGATSSGSFDLVCGKWQSTAAITSITIFAGYNFNVGTTFALYGIKAA